MADIIYEDAAVLVVKKPAGTESQRGRSFSMDLESELKNELARRMPGHVPYLGVVHRLDRPVSGVMVYAKTKEAAAGLSAQFASGKAKKVYEALVTAPMTPTEGTLRDWIKTDPKSNRSIIVPKPQAAGRASAEKNGKPGQKNDRPGKTAGKSGAKPGKQEAREAILDYQMIPPAQARAFQLQETPAGLAIGIAGRMCGSWMGADIAQVYALRVRLHTGRHHQIRVQLANAGAPVLGDARYGVRPEGLMMPNAVALCAAELTFFHPFTGKQVTFSV